MHNKKQKHKSAASVVWSRVWNAPGARFGIIVFVIMVLAAVFAPLLTPYDYATPDLLHSFALPSFSHILGTDELGRDMYTRIIFGARYSLGIASLSTVIALFIGMVFGSIAGYFGGMADNIIMRIFDVIQSIPGILLSIVVAIVLGNNAFNLVLALAVVAIPGYARVLRAQILSIRKMEYIEAAVATNCSVPRILMGYVIPNAMAPLIVQMTMQFPGQIIATSSLAYIGLGIQPPTPEWGAMLNSAKEYITKAPLTILIPGIAIIIAVLCLNMIGDGMRDALDPRLKK